MDFTREPIIDTVITPKEGCKLVVRSSKSNGQEEYFVDALEVVSFGHSLFYRSTERPKAFLVPATDYEVLEVREARLVLKNVGLDRSIKIGGGAKAPKEAVRQEKVAILEKEESVTDEENSPEVKAEAKVDRKRERRRHQRRRRGARDEDSKEEGSEGTSSDTDEDKEESEFISGDNSQNSSAVPITSLLPPPSMLISETINRYKENALFKGAFFTKEPIEEAGDKETLPLSQDASAEGKALAEENTPEASEETHVALAQPEYGSFEMSEAEEEEIYLQRLKNNAHEEKPLHAEKEHAEGKIEKISEATFLEAASTETESKAPTETPPSE